MSHEDSSPLSSDELHKALRIRSPGLVKEIYDTITRQTQYEQGRQGRLDAKANTLLTANGLALTILFTFARDVLANAKKSGALVGGSSRLVEIILWFTVISGFASAILAISSLLISKGYRMFSERNLLNRRILWGIDDIGNKSLSEDGDVVQDYSHVDVNDEASESEKDNVRVAQFRCFLIQEQLEILRAHVKTHDRKAITVSFGQGFFCAFLLGISIIALITIHLA